ncbi:MAG: sigma-70 family RNA polymerase sigma factor [Gammaproteobacteria bacterium]|nr:sigma-70 family RNA polymerase sigma factor [Gammaproteobacteria bacterium]
MLPHLDAAYRFARWLAGAGAGSGDADDIVQDAFLRAFRAFDSLRGGDVKAWLFTIVRNCHATAVQQRQRRGAVPLAEEHLETMRPVVEDPATDPESVTAAAEERRTLARLVSALPEEHREVLLLREMEDMSYREIAQVTQVPIGTVMSRLARARATLRGKWLEQSAGEPRAVR